MEPLKIETLKTLCAPFLEEGAELLYMSAFANRIYIGQCPVGKVRGSDEEPWNLEVPVVDGTIDYQHVLRELGTRAG